MRIGRVLMRSPEKSARLADASDACVDYFESQGGAESRTGARNATVGSDERETSPTVVEASRSPETVLACLWDRDLDGNPWTAAER